jgi:RimJ/RimL family protein N-acetyltransferase
MTTLIHGEVARGERVVLREKRLGDAENDYRWRRDRELTRYDAARPLNVSFHEFLAVHREEVLFPTPYRRSLAIEDLDGRHIGNVMYYNIDALRQETELGITIGAPLFRDRGYGTEAVQLLVEYLCFRAGFRRVYLKTLVWNDRARRSFEKAGFVEYDRVNRGGHDFLLMELRRECLTAGGSQ